MIGWNVLRARTVSHLVAAGICSGNVEASRFKATKNDDLPIAHVYVRGATNRGVGGKANAGDPKYQRVTKLTLAILAKGNDGAAEDWLSTEVEKALDALLEAPTWLTPASPPFVEEVNAIDVSVEQYRDGDVHCVAAIVTLDVVDQVRFVYAPADDFAELNAVDEQVAEEDPGDKGVDIADNAPPDGVIDGGFKIDVPTE